ncbi:hypothetical protein [Mycobacteroides abscessus]|uniref:hypothetical protein n=1 Tax=Mycobacteroides abscessus TaxID=36809 RepID=UPI0011C3A997|nr:hypothetical protein [Mycobacteroides abscessus]
MDEANTVEIVDADNDELFRRFLEGHNASNWLKMIDTFDATKATFVLLSLSAFDQEPFVLYAALAYASKRGVSVQVIPRTYDPQEPINRTTA